MSDFGIRFVIDSLGIHIGMSWPALLIGAAMFIILMVRR